MDGEAGDADRLAVPERDRADGTVDEGRHHLHAALREGDRPVGDVGGTAHEASAIRPHTVVRAKDDIGVEHLEQRLEVALARRLAKRVYNLALSVEVHVWRLVIALNA